MKRAIMAVALVVLCALTGATQSRNRRRPATPSEASIISILQIDFRNYTFALNGKSYKLIDGFYAENLTPDTQWGLEMAGNLYYSDLTGDKNEEAAFVLRYGPINGPKTSEVRVYALQKGKPTVLATFRIADAVNCELDHYMRIEDGTIIIERVYGNGTRCDYNEITQYRWNGAGFKEVGDIKKTTCRCM